MADVEQTQKMIPFVTCEISLCMYVCELVFGVNVFDLDLEVQFDSIKQPIKSNSVGSGNMSHCRASSLYDHLDHCFVVFKHIQQSFLLRRLDSLSEIACVCESCEVENKLHVYSTTGLPVLFGSESCFQDLKQSDPTNRERESRLN